MQLKLSTGISKFVMLEFILWFRFYSGLKCLC